MNGRIAEKISMAPYPRYFAFNDIPVKMDKTADGGLEVTALDLATGELVRDYEFLRAYFQGGRDIDVLTKEEFDALVAKERDRSTGPKSSVTTRDRAE
jgi:hypothetical protein